MCPATLMGRRRDNSTSDVKQQTGGDHRNEKRCASGREERQSQSGHWHQADDTTHVDDRLDTEPRRDSTGKDQPEELIYGITKALWSKKTRSLLDKGHPKGKAIRLETALKGVLIPVHPGAARYYKEVGMMK